ncbi:hypothetical protein [Nitrosomonas marina]|uniref:DUF4145 domain-containing protein n=1 Tax=Nitrosomonas marina TaxID=917 RepID=A0A1H8GUT1_9PROT|nr:hypothetical protein [Nitrosomonas marina]SEN47812.1 hypothetical protein SAMN05216325_1201 [Nitrosomonas marina]
MTSILDEALEGEIKKHHGRMPKKYSKTLGGRISFASDNNMINNGDNLHDVRGRRNDTAHEISATVIWDELEADSFEIEMALQNLNLVGNRPEL